MTPTRSIPWPRILAEGFAIPVSILLAACGGPSDQPSSGLGDAPAVEPTVVPPAIPAEAWGELLFETETFGGNGRACSTCHDLQRFGTVAPTRAAALYEANPTAPLFRPLDGDDGSGVGYERLLRNATVRTPLALAADPATGLAVRPCDAPAQDSVVLNRGIPTVFNAALDGSLMTDGREGADLGQQALNAILTHYEPTRQPTPAELEALAAFERTLYATQAIVSYLTEGTALDLPVPGTPAEVRGRAFLDPDRACGLCHSGGLRNRTSAFHPLAIGHNFEATLVGQEPENPEPKLEWCFVDPARGEVVEGPLGSERVFERPTSDPGAAILPGEKVFPTPDDRLEAMSNQELAARIGPVFKIPTLWGVASTAPYFHDNSAATLEDVVAHYNFLFEHRPELARAAGCDPDRPECMDVRDRADIVAYLQLFIFDGLGARAPQLGLSGP